MSFLSPSYKSLTTLEQSILYSDSDSFNSKEGKLESYNTCSTLPDSDKLDSEVERVSPGGRFMAARLSFSNLSLSPSLEGQQLGILKLPELQSRDSLDTGYQTAMEEDQKQSSQKKDTSLIFKTLKVPKNNGHLTQIFEQLASLKRKKINSSNKKTVNLQNRKDEMKKIKKGNKNLRKDKNMKRSFLEMASSSIYKMKVKHRAYFFVNENNVTPSPKPKFNMKNRGRILKYGSHKNEKMKILGSDSTNEIKIFDKSGRSKQLGAINSIYSHKKINLHVKKGIQYSQRRKKSLLSSRNKSFVIRSRKEDSIHNRMVKNLGLK